MGEPATLVLVGHPSDDGITTKLPYSVDVSLYQPPTPHLLLLG